MIKIINYEHAKNWIKENYSRPNDESLFKCLVSLLTCVYADETTHSLYGNGKYKMSSFSTKSGNDEFLDFDSYETEEEGKNIRVINYHFNNDVIDDVMYFWLEFNI